MCYFHPAVQGWSSFVPRFSAVDFVSFYVELPMMLIMFLVWSFLHRPTSACDMTSSSGTGARRWSDIVDPGRVDLKADEYDETSAELQVELEREQKRRGWSWRLYYLLA